MAKLLELEEIIMNSLFTNVSMMVTAISMELMLSSVPQPLTMSVETDGLLVGNNVMMEIQ